MLKPVVVQGPQPGGQMTITTDVENYPGFADVIQGPWLMEQMRAQAEHVGTEMIMDQIVNVELNRRPFRLEGDSGDTYTCDALIIATGAQARWLGLPTEESSKATASPPAPPATASSIKGKDVVGHRRWQHGRGRGAVFDQLREQASRLCIGAIASARSAFMQERLFKNPKIKVIWNSVLEEVTGTDNPKARERGAPAKRAVRSRHRAGN